MTTRYTLAAYVLSVRTRWRRCVWTRVWKVLINECNCISFVIFNMNRLKQRCALTMSAVSDKSEVLRNQDALWGSKITWADASRVCTM